MSDSVTDDPAALANGTGLTPPGDPPPADPPPGDPPAPAVYDLESDPVGLKTLDLKGAKIAGKFDSIPAVLDALSAAEKELAVPESYEIQGEAWQKLPKETQSSVLDFFKDAAVPQRSAEKLAAGAIAMAQAVNNAVGLVSLSEAWNLPTPQAEQRKNETVAWAREVYGDEYVVEQLKFGAAGINSLYRDRTSNWEKKPFKGDGSIPKAEKSRAEIMYPSAAQ